jgi:hypothetical protein
MVKPLYEYVVGVKQTRFGSVTVKAANIGDAMKQAEDAIGITWNNADVRAEVIHSSTAPIRNSVGKVLKRGKRV